MPLPLIAGAVARVAGGKAISGAATRAGASQGTSGVLGQFGGAALQGGAIRGAVGHGQSRQQNEAATAPPLGVIANDNFQSIINAAQFNPNM